ncbi:hypothetical protein V8C43DRAFT_175031 [Trichoderma afarasin]
MACRARSSGWFQDRAASQTAHIDVRPQHLRPEFAANHGVRNGVGDGAFPSWAPFCVFCVGHPCIALPSRVESMRGRGAVSLWVDEREAKRAPRSANRPTLTEILQSLLKMMPAMWVFDLAAVTKVLTRIRNPGGLSVNAGTKGDCTRKYTRIELGVYM